MIELLREVGLMGVRGEGIVSGIVATTWAYCLPVSIFRAEDMKRSPKSRCLDRLGY